MFAQETKRGAAEGDEELMADDVESVYDDDDDVDVDVDAEVEDADVNEPKTKFKKTKLEDEDDDDEEEDDDEEDDDEEDEDNDDNDDNEAGEALSKKRILANQTISESTEIQIVAPANRITSEYMTLYEYAMIVGTRATHISNGAVLFTALEGLSDPIEIAKKEMDENKCPLSITRKVSSTRMEIWSVNEMIKPAL